MTLMTEKDKKLLIVTGIALGIVLLAVLAIWPLWTSCSNLSTQITEQELEKQEKELKVSQLPLVQKQEEEIDAKLAALKEHFYEIMSSAEIDRLMTEMAVGAGLYVDSLSIGSIQTDTYTQLDPYDAVLARAMDVQDAVEETFTANGVYTVNLNMNVTGSRETLQAFLDMLITLEPRMRVVSFTWSESKLEGASGSTLNLSLELYMCQDIDEYIETMLKQQAAEAAAAEAEEAE